MFNFKELFALIGLLMIIGIVGILYRVAMESPTNIARNGQVLCSQDTRTCANGTVEKRTELDCTFARCPQYLPSATTTATTTVIGVVATSSNNGTHNAGTVTVPN